MMEKFVATIKKKYRERLINREKQWPVCHTNKFFRLELVIRKRGESYFGSQQRGMAVNLKRTPLAYNDLFGDRGQTEQPVRFILVEGDAGIGKTTLCTSLSEDWANGKLLTQFELLLYLPLRHKSASVSSFCDLLHLWCLDQDACATVANYIEQREGEGVLIVADGWDELVELNRQEGSYMYRLLFGEEFPFMSVLLTSRPAYSPQALDLIPYHSVQWVEIHGFSEENINEYIQSEFADSEKMAERLLNQLENNPLIASICSIPLNCAIICHLWRTLKDTLPNSMTELYTKIILNILLRSLHKKVQYESIRSLTSFDSIPVDLQDAWWCQCQFAFHMLKQGQIIFAEHDFVHLFPQSSTLLGDILNFGLLQQAEVCFETGREVSFHYLHLTIQEYLAALHLARQPCSRQLKILNALHFVKKNLDSLLEYNLCSSDSSGASNVIKSRKFNIVWRFFFGLYFNVLKKEEDQEPLDIKKAIETFDPHTDALVLCHCAFEAKNQSVSHEIIKLLNKLSNLLSISLTMSIVPKTAHDCAAVIYVLDNIPECNNVEITFFNCHVTDTLIFSLADVLERKGGRLQITKLDLRFNKITDKGIQYLSNRASTAFQSLQRLHLLSNVIGGEGVKQIMTALTNNSLSSLGLSLNPLKECGMQELENAIGGNKLANLRQLDIIHSLTEDADINGGLLVTLLEAILNHCPHFSSLDVSDNNLGVPGAIALGRSMSQLTQNKTGSILCMNEVMLGDEGLVAFINNLQGSCYLNELQIKKNDIHAIGISCLANGMHSQMIVMEGVISQIFLDDNPLGLGGTVEVAKMLSMCSSCQIIELKRCQLAASTMDNATCTARDVGLQLCSMSRPSQMQILNLTGNNFTGEGIHILAGLMFKCPFVHCLKCDYCGITSSDLEHLLVVLTELKKSLPMICSALRQWNLKDNEIDDRGVTKLIEYIPSLFPALGRNAHEIHFDNNPVSDEVLECLQGEQKKKEKEREIKIDKSMKQMLQALALAKSTKTNCEVSTNNQDEDDHRYLKQQPGDPVVSLPVNRYSYQCGLFFLAALVVPLLIVVLILGNDVRPKQEVNVPIVPSKRDYLVMQSFDQIMDKLSSSIGPGIDPTKILDQSQVCTLSKSIDSVLQPVNTDQSTLPSCAPFISNTTDYHQLTKDDIPVLRELIATHGSYKQWCVDLKIDSSTCNVIEHSEMHYNDKVLDVAKAYWNEILESTWEDIIKVLCKYRKAFKAAKELAKKYGIKYDSLCSS